MCKAAALSESHPTIYTYLSLPYSQRPLTALSGDHHHTPTTTALLSWCPLGALSGD